jgi:hypothetical protein
MKLWTAGLLGPKKESLLHKNSSEGSVTMEYIIVSTFALLVSISAVTWIGKVVKDQVEKMASKVGSDAGEFDVSWDSDP